MTGPRLVLASASPRREQLLQQIGIKPYAIRSANIDESPHARELPRAYCRRMAETKARSVVLEEGEVVLAADTIVALGRRILGKPDNEEMAEEYLRMLSGRRHKVVTAIFVGDENIRRERDVVSTVKLKRLSDAEIQEYIASGEWRGKAGAYGIQGLAEAYIPWISGSFSGIVGLPLAEAAALLRTAGIRPS